MAATLPAALNPNEELQPAGGEVGRYGGRLVIGQRSEPKTLNPVTATDAVSREVIGRLMADLITINKASQQTEPALAKSWKMSADGRTFTLKLRRVFGFQTAIHSMPMMFSFLLPCTWTRR
jgi:ABC-type transport system substrate-binding protein